ncbi:MAG: hypothetical protein V3W44_10905 [Dehalococcoidales bacterium]
MNPELKAIMARVKLQMESPEHQARVAKDEYETRQAAERAKAAAYVRRIERLSRIHVGYVRRHCGPDMMPKGWIPTIWQKLIHEWDWHTSLIMVGPTETQKTTAATWAAMWAACDREAVAHTTALRIATASPEELEWLRDAGLIIVDELHRLADQPPWKVAPVWDLIDYRYQDMTTTIVLATVNPAAMSDLAGVEVLRRIPLKLTTDRQETL